MVLDILDKYKRESNDECEKLGCGKCPAFHFWDREYKEQALDILDKYKAESEG